MEGLRKRSIALAVTFVVIGVGFQVFAANAAKISRSESWMETHTPKNFAGYSMVPARDPKAPDVTYKSDKLIYDTLHPYGIVAREYQEDRGAKHFDVNVIASSTKDSFHDPRVCFTAQGWNIKNERMEIVHTKTRGDVPVTLADLDHKDYGVHPAVFFYKGPEGFTSSTSGIKIQIFKRQAMTLRDQEGVFYRVIALNRDCTSEDLLKFVGQFLDESGPMSDGFF